MDLNLQGKRALVTGSSSGIGAGIARMLAVEGASVVVHGRNRARAEAVAAAIIASGGKAVAVCGDLADETQIAALAEGALAAFGGIDILVNNAGGSAETADKSWFGGTAATLLEAYQANVVASFCLIKLFSPAMKERGWGRIINIATAAAITPTSGQPDYGPAKAALINLSLGFSKTMARSGVTSNCISPGMVRTEGVRDFLANFAQKRGWGDDIAQAEAYVAKGTGQTVKAIGEVEDIAFAVAMLASPRADYINGANFHVDGGISPAIG
jgi:NAD(P)-dependent dehydrogenase (short-subunit alcohol dehydrogenase family)